MKIGTEQEWQTARKELLGAERDLEEHTKRVEDQRRELPWVPVEKEYTFATDDGPKSLPELFDGRSQLLIYHLMFGEDWPVACPGCSSLADGLGGVVTHVKAVANRPFDFLASSCSTVSPRSMAYRSMARRAFIRGRAEADEMLAQLASWGRALRTVGEPRAAVTSATAVLSKCQSTSRRFSRTGLAIRHKRARRRSPRDPSDRLPMR